MTTITIEKAIVHRALSALEYHTQQTRPIHNTELVIEELRAALAAPAERIKELEAENEQLRKDVDRYQWLKSAKGLTLESERGEPWTRENGSTFIPSHRLCAGGTQFAPHETLDGAIDAAMKETP